MDGTAAEAAETLPDSSAAAVPQHKTSAADEAQDSTAARAPSNSTAADASPGASRHRMSGCRKAVHAVFFAPPKVVPLPAQRTAAEEQGQETV